ncbi:MAG: hypothetical protein Q7S20_10015 [Gemmatimonadaceae bacterium]|nr:hypothetical protein [Gemmatimonadaceae bacterium]
MRRSIRAIAAIPLFALVAHPMGAQLRPLEPINWRLLRGGATVAGEAGFSRLSDQRASLAGTSGDLWEVGNISLAWRTGRVVVEVAGTAQRFFRERSRFEEPYPDVEPANDDRRHDSGDFRISTTIRLTPEEWPVRSAVRFGTRLPSTDNTTGLDRDAVDFFATVGASTLRGGLAFDSEAGIGIHSSREQSFEQDDLLLYASRAEYRGWHIAPSIAILGQLHGTTHAAIRGVENLGELRIGLRAGGRRWIRAEFVKGYEIVSPSSGVIVTGGIAH